MCARTRRPASVSGAGRPAESGQCRIIGGAWRGRRVEFPAAEGLRPTPDRVRETLFNWLQPRLAGSRCLDLFAGSGVLGLEAASRGARQVILVERDRRAMTALEQTVQRLDAASRVELHRADALGFLGRDGAPCDIIFVDPPYRSELIVPVSRALESGGWLRAGSLIYLEQPARSTLAELPPGWRVIRSKKTSRVGYHLLERQ